MTDSLKYCKHNIHKAAFGENLNPLLGLKVAIKCIKQFSVALKFLMNGHIRKKSQVIRLNDFHAMPKKNERGPHPTRYRVKECKSLYFVGD